MLSAGLNEMPLGYEEVGGSALPVGWIVFGILWFGTIAIVGWMFTGTPPPHTQPQCHTASQAFNEWITASYIPSHHWFGTCRMGTDPSKGAVTDSSGRVYGTRKLRVADASIYPIKVVLGWVWRDVSPWCAVALS